MNYPKNFREYIEGYLGRKMEKESKIDNKFNTQEVPDLKEYLKNEPPLIDKAKSEVAVEEGAARQTEDHQNKTQKDTDNADRESVTSEDVVESTEAAVMLSGALTGESKSKAPRTSRRAKPESTSQVVSSGEQMPSRRRRRRNQKAETPKKTTGAFVREWGKDVAIAVVIAVIVMQFIKPTIVKQRSMQPNFYTNDYLFISKQSYKLFGGQPQRGDVIVFKSKLEDAEGETKMLIKRVIGVPGDVISIHDGKVYINGKEIDDSYTMDSYTNGDIKELVVPADHLFCMGDNRAVSIDSRSESVGLVSYGDIIGKVVFRVFPLRKFGTIHNPYKN